MTIAVTNSARSVAFQGVIAAPIKTTVSGYSPPNNDTFSAGQLWPAICLTTGVTGITPSAAGADVFDPKFGVTSFRMGAPAPNAQTDVQPTWYNGKLTGVANEFASGTLNFYSYSFNAPLGSGFTRSSLGASVIASRASNLTTPFRTGACAMQSQFGVGYGYAEVSGNQSFIWFNPQSLVVTHQQNLFSGIPLGGAQFFGIVPAPLSSPPVPTDFFAYNDAGTLGACVFTTDYSTFGNFYQLTWDNGTVDAQMKAGGWASGGSTNTTVFGFVSYFKSAITINGVTYQPYAILTSPDATKWWLLTLQPQDDAARAAWVGGAGSASVMIDPNGAAWFSNTGPVPSKVFSSYGAGPIITPPISQIPPVNIPVNPGLYR